MYEQIVVHQSPLVCYTVCPCTQALIGVCNRLEFGLAIPIITNIMANSDTNVVIICIHNRNMFVQFIYDEAQFHRSESITTSNPTVCAQFRIPLLLLTPFTDEERYSEKKINQRDLTNVYLHTDKIGYRFCNRTTIRDSLLGTSLYLCVHTIMRRLYSRAGPMRWLISLAVTIGSPTGAKVLSLSLGA